MLIAMIMSEPYTRRDALLSEPCELNAKRARGSCCREFAAFASCHHHFHHLHPHRSWRHVLSASASVLSDLEHFVGIKEWTVSGTPMQFCWVRRGPKSAGMFVLRNELKPSNSSKCGNYRKIPTLLSPCARCARAWGDIY